MTAQQTLDGCARLASTAGPELAQLAHRIGLARDRLDQPMRVAVAGQIKRGKSTLVNALLGRDVAPTARLEATFTVSEFRFAAEPQVTVHYRDPDREPAIVPVARFREFTVNDPAQARVLHGVRRVEYGLPIPLLETFRLVDTPGLGSVHDVDSANTVEFLGIGGFLAPGEEEKLLATMRAVGRDAADVHHDSAEELDGADAVVYLFDRAVNERDLAAVADFLGPLGESMNALKAFGVLSRCDETYWPPGPDQPGRPDPLTWNPLEVAGRIVEGYRNRPRTKRMFHTVLPVAGLVGVGAQTLPDDAFGWLAELGALEPERLVRLLGDPGRFATRPTLAGVALDPQRRATLIRELGAWGSLRAARYLGDGMSVAQVRDQLVVDSGVDRLRETIRNHFGNRADLIKLDRGLGEVAGEVARCRLAAQEQGRPPADAVAEVADRIQDLRTRDRRFAELDVLVRFYNAELDLSEAEGDELLRVTGEYGGSVAARLGMPENTAPDELIATATARIDAWTRRLDDPLVRRTTTTAAQKVLRTYDRLVADCRTLVPTDRSSAR